MTLWSAGQPTLPLRTVMSLAEFTYEPAGAQSIHQVQGPDLGFSIKNRNVFSYTIYLSTPHDFLSMIFGVLGKFRIDNYRKNPSTIFLEIKKIRTQFKMF